MNIFSKLFGDNRLRCPKCDQILDFKSEEKFQYEPSILGSLLQGGFYHLNCYDMICFDLETQRLKSK